MKLVAVTVGMLALSVLALAGNGAGGIDTAKPSNAWFPGPEKTIKSCFLLHPKFGVNAETIIQEVQASYATWGRYIERKKLAYDLGSAPVMTTKIEISRQCTGKEDLKFYFGVEDEEVKKAKQHYINPYAFAEQTSFDWNTSWGKGFIWLALPGTVAKESPNWTSPNILRLALLHEIGHTLGNGHVDGTVMANFSIDPTINPLMGTSLLEIDGHAELHLCRTCGENYLMGGENTTLFSEYLKDAFHYLIGKSPTGTPKAVFRMTAEKQLPKGEISYEDSSGIVPFQIKSKALVSRSPVPVFDICYKINENSFGCTRGDGGTFNYSATLQGMGKSWEVILNRNALGLIDIVEANTGRVLFRSITTVKN